ncbi:MAG: hypothetical protein ABI658_20060 [Acidimicrobiales bacterium]
MCALAIAACGSGPNAEPDADTTTTAATPVATITAAESTTTTVATTRSSMTATSPLSAPPVTAALGGPLATFNRVDVPLALSAPVNLVAASPSDVVAIGWRAIGAARQSASTAVSADGQQWRAVNTAWSDGPTVDGLPRSFGAPRALAYADGIFVSVGVRVDVAEDGRSTSTAIAARSVDGATWASIDLPAAPDSLLPTQLVRLGSRWVMAAELWGGTPQRQTLLFSSSDGRTWESSGTLDFQLQYLRTTAAGLFAMGFRGENNSTQWITATSIDARTWTSSVLNLGATSPVQSVLVDGDQVVLIVSEDVTGFSKDRRARLLASRDGLSWQTMPTPPCFVAGDYVGPAAAVGGTWAIVIDAETERLAVSRDQGTTWSCTNLTGEAFEARWGPPYLIGISDVQGKLALVGGRTIEPGAQSNWVAAIWYLS